jgi:16S rRNA (cytidine1402-2'-O)-methyltransferase
MTSSGDAVGRLVICPTPIGNLQDVTLRVLVALAEADVVACEDTRHTKVLLERHGLAAQLVSFHEHNERARTPELVERIGAGQRVALVSDAGTPLVSDPGFALMQACLQAGLAVEVLPGPSAVVTALVASGLPAGRWLFVGFLPRKRAELADLLLHNRETLVAFESPRRLGTTLRLLAERDPSRPAAVCRELTKRHEEVRRGSAVELAAHYGHGASSGQSAGGPRGKAPEPGAQARAITPAPATTRGEVVLVLGAASPQRADHDQAIAAVRELVAAGARTRSAAKSVARLTGVGANELYRELTSGEQ